MKAMTALRMCYFVDVRHSASISTYVPQGVPAPTRLSLAKEQSVIEKAVPQLLLGLLSLRPELHHTGAFSNTVEDKKRGPQM